MATAEDSSIPGVHLRQAERNVPADSGVFQSPRDVSRHDGRKRGADQRERAGRQIHHRRGRKLRLWNRDEQPLGTGKRIPTNWQRDFLHKPVQGVENQTPRNRAAAARASRSSSAVGQADETVHKDHQRNAGVQGEEQRLQA